MQRSLKEKLTRTQLLPFLSRAPRARPLGPPTPPSRARRLDQVLSSPPRASLARRPRRQSPAFPRPSLACPHPSPALPAHASPATASLLRRTVCRRLLPPPVAALSRAWRPSRATLAPPTPSRVCPRHRNQLRPRARPLVAT